MIDDQWHGRSSIDLQKIYQNIVVKCGQANSRLGQILVWLYIWPCDYSKSARTLPHI